MKHSIALVTGTNSGLGYSAASMLATNGYREVIVTGCSLARVQETAGRVDQRPIRAAQPSSTDCRVAPFRK